MATEAQYNFFKVVYDEENERYTRLGNRATLYFSIISFFLGTIVFKFDDLKSFLVRFHVPTVLYLIIGTLLVLSLVFTALAIVVRKYEGICDPVALIRKFGSTPPTDDAFRDDVLVDLAVATQRNAAQNGKAAGLLKCSSYLILGAVCMQLAVFVVALISRL